MLPFLLYLFSIYKYIFKIGNKLNKLCYFILFSLTFWQEYCPCQIFLKNLTVSNYCILCTYKKWLNYACLAVFRLLHISFIMTFGLILMIILYISLWIHLFFLLDRFLEMLLMNKHLLDTFNVLTQIVNLFSEVLSLIAVCETTHLTMLSIQCPLFLLRNRGKW